MSSHVRRSVVISATIVAVLAAGASGINREKTFASAPSTNHAKAAQNVYVILNWVPNVEFDGLWVAQQKGWFKAAGINLSFKPWSPGVFPETDAAARGGNTFGFDSGAAIVINRSKGVPITAVYSDTQKSVFGLTVLASSGIHKLTQLRNKKIGYQSHELYVPETMMSCVGLTAGKDYKTVPVGFTTDDLTSGQVDAHLTFITNEPIALKLQGVKTRTFAAADYCFHFYDDVMFATDSLIKSNPALVKSFTAIVAKGFQWAHTHPDVAARLTVAHYFPASKAGSGVTAKLNLEQQILESRTFSPFSKDSHGVFSGLMSAAYWTDSIKILDKYHQISKMITANSLFTNKFNPNTK
jgi:ABC-type nitrate/sulfonate/bicarbonate transport system substrate-binding protein